MPDWKRVFMIIWTGQLFSTLSSAVVGYAVVFWLSVETKSAEVLAFATIAALLPQLLLGPFTGVYIDRWNRKKIMIWADLFIALCSLVMAILFLEGHVPTLPGLSIHFLPCALREELSIYLQCRLLFRSSPHRRNSCG